MLSAARLRIFSMPIFFDENFKFSAKVCFSVGKSKYLKTLPPRVRVFCQHGVIIPVIPGHFFIKPCRFYEILVFTL